MRTSNIIKDTTDGIHPLWQSISGGFRKGEMYLISTPRQTGKSYFHKIMQESMISFKEPKYKFSRNWYQADFDLKDYDAVDEWCEQQFGPHPKRPDAWSRWWHKFHNSILFRDEKDYILFMLRWS